MEESDAPVEQATAAPGEKRKLTVHAVRETVKRLEQQGDADPEESHYAEDAMKDETLRRAAAGEDVADLAREALKVNDLQLTRWYA